MTQEELNKLRQQYAGMAMQGIISNPEAAHSVINVKGELSFEIAVARIAVAHANALIKELGVTVDEVADKKEYKKPYSEYDKILVHEIQPDEHYYHGSKTRFLKVCRCNDIVTLGDLLRFGRGNFLQQRNAGMKLITAISDAIEEQYNVKW